MAAITICSDFGAPKNQSLTLFPLFPHLFPMKWWDWMPWSSFSECWTLSQLFHSPFLLSSRGFWVPLHFPFCHKGGVICISEVIDISPGNLDCSLCFFQSSVSHDVLCSLPVSKKVYYIFTASWWHSHFYMWRQWLIFLYKTLGLILVYLECDWFPLTALFKKILIDNQLT